MEKVKEFFTLSIQAELITKEDIPPLEQFIFEVIDSVKSGKKNILFLYKQDLSIKECVTRLILSSSFFLSAYDYDTNIVCDLENKDRLVFLMKKNDITEYTIALNLKNAEEKFKEVVFQADKYGTVLDTLLREERRANDVNDASPVLETVIHRIRELHTTYKEYEEKSEMRAFLIPHIHAVGLQLFKIGGEDLMANAICCWPPDERSFFSKAWEGIGQWEKK